MSILEQIRAFFFKSTGLHDGVPKVRARGDVVHSRPRADGSMEVLDHQVIYNLVTNAGRDFMHTQTYGTSASSNGLNYIALSDDAVTETNSSTTLSNEIASNGLGRAQGTVAHTSGTNTTTVQKTFTATGAQAAQKAALFTASSGGTMNHVLGFTERSLQINDTLQITFTLTIG